MDRTDRLCLVASLSNILPEGDYIWSVVTIDAGYTRSTWAAEQNLAVEPLQPSSAQYNLAISSTAGGLVVHPSEGDFTYEDGTVVAWKPSLMRVPVCRVGWRCGYHCRCQSCFYDYRNER
jgi:hypothetical protein